MTETKDGKNYIIENYKEREFENIIHDIKEFLKNHSEWKKRYNRYINNLKGDGKKYRTPIKFPKVNPPLFKYTTISASENEIILRYKGQTVGKIIYERENFYLKIDKTKEENFGCPLGKGKYPSKDEKDFNYYWKLFTDHFNTNPYKESHNEATVESELISLIETRSCMKPVVLNYDERFQMPTPLAASGKNLIYADGNKQGGIDILAKIGKGGNGTKLTVIEVKDENTPEEPAEEVIKQALAYSTFIRELLRSEHGIDWYHKFGFQCKNIEKGMPKKLVIMCLVAMPFDNAKNKSIPVRTIPIKDTKGDDEIKLGFISLKIEKKGNTIKKIEIEKICK